MTLTLWDVYWPTALTTLVIALALTGGVIVYVRKLHKSIMAAITALQQTNTTAAQEQHTQTGLLVKLVDQIDRLVQVTIIAGGPRLLGKAFDDRETLRRQELVRFLVNTGRFFTPDEQHNLIAWLPENVKERIAAKTTTHQNGQGVLTVIVQEAAGYSQTPTLATTIQFLLNGSDLGKAFAAFCAEWDIPLPSRLPPHEGENDGG